MAIKSFHEFIDELSNNTVFPVEQKISSCSYYGLKNKPQRLEFIVWNESADYIDRLFRALFLGNYQNQLAVLKIMIKN
jgi:hypothetical protein